MSGTMGKGPCRCGCGQQVAPNARYYATGHYVGRPPRGNAFGYQRSGTPRAMSSPTTRDINWAAGFLEGEGSFVFAAGEIIDVCQVQREPLERLQRFFGGRIHKHSTRKLNVWRVYGSRARGVMLTLYALFSPRRQQQVRGVCRP